MASRLKVWPRVEIWEGAHCHAAALLAALSACASPPPVSHIEAKARLDVPIAICRNPLGTGDMSDAGVPRAEVYWSVLFTSFRGSGTALRPEDADCVGQLVGASAALAPIEMSATQVSSADGSEQIAWLPFSRAAPGRAAGLLALVRPRTSEIDVHAVGRYEGSLRHSRFELGRLGTSQVIVAHDESCADSKVDVECESTLKFYVVSGGTLVAATESPAERLRFGTSKGLGRLKYRLTTTPPVFEKGSIRVHETVQVKDVNDEDVRKAEGDRVIDLDPDGRLVARQDSLWSKVGAAPPERP